LREVAALSRGAGLEVEDAACWALAAVVTKARAAAASVTRAAWEWQRRVMEGR
jgi:hypothetical protein